MIFDENTGEFYDRIGTDGVFKISHDEWFLDKTPGYSIAARKDLTDFVLFNSSDGRTVAEKNRGHLHNPIEKCSTISSREYDGQRYGDWQSGLFFWYVGNYYMILKGKSDLICGPFADDQSSNPSMFDGWIKIIRPDEAGGGYNYVNADGKFLLDRFVDDATDFRYGSAGIWENNEFSIIDRKGQAYVSGFQSSGEAFPYYDNALAYVVNNDGDVTLIRQDKSVAILDNCKDVKFIQKYEKNDLVDTKRRIPRLLLVRTSNGFAIINLKFDEYVELRSTDKYDAISEAKTYVDVYSSSKPIRDAKQTVSNRQIVCAFNCEGKSEFSKSHTNAIDYDRDFFYYKTGGSLPNKPSYDDVNFVWSRDHFQENQSFPDNMIEAINKLPASVEYILLTASKDVLRALKDAEMEYTLVIPEPEDGELPDWYLDRYENRIENSPRFDGADTDMTLRNQLFDEERAQYRVVKRIGEQGTMHGCKGIVYTTENEYLSDVIDQIK